MNRLQYFREVMFKLNILGLFRNDGAVSAKSSGMSYHWQRFREKGVPSSAVGTKCVAPLKYLT